MESDAVRAKVGFNPMNYQPTLFKNDEQRTVYTAAIWEIRKAQLRKYGPWDHDLHRAQLAKAIRRFGVPGNGLVDRGPSPKNVPQDVEEDAKNAKSSGGAPQYPKAIAAGESLGLRAPWEYGAVHPVGFRKLHPHGMTRTGLEAFGPTAQYQSAVYWMPNEYTAPANQTIYLGAHIKALGDTLGGSMTGARVVDPAALSNMYGVQNYVHQWRQQELEARLILAQRILHTIGSAVLAAFPVTTAFAPAAYAAGNAAIDIQEQLLSDDPEWADIMDSVNEAVSGFLELNTGETPDATPVVTDEGQVLAWEGMEWSEALDLGYTSTMAIVDAVNEAYTTGDASAAVAVLADFGIELPAGAVEDLVNEISMMTGINPGSLGDRHLKTLDSTAIVKGSGRGSAPSIHALRAGTGTPVDPVAGTPVDPVAGTPVDPVAGTPVDPVADVGGIEPTMGGGLLVVGLAILALFLV